MKGAKKVKCGFISFLLTVKKQQRAACADKGSVLSQPYQTLKKRGKGNVQQ
jgi:hypothetical protein